MSQNSPEKTRPLLAMVALHTPTMPSPAVLTQSFEALSGISVDLTSLQAKEGNVVFRLGNDRAAIALMPAPIPWSNLEGPCATAWWWPDATKKMKYHASHILVALLGETGDLIQRYITLTRLTAVVTAHVDAAGIYWGGGALVHDPQVFIEQAKNISLGNPPLHLWIDFRVEQNEDGSCRLFTTGMKAFHHMEIEIPHSTKPPAEVLAFAHAIADYAITSNKAIREGETIGRSEAEKVRVSYVPSMWVSSITAMRLDF
jgi:hypothetical protein